MFRFHPPRIGEDLTPFTFFGRGRSGFHVYYFYCSPPVGIWSSAGIIQVSVCVCGSFYDTVLCVQPPCSYWLTILWYAPSYPRCFVTSSLYCIVLIVWYTHITRVVLVLRLLLPFLYVDRLGLLHTSNFFLSFYSFLPSLLSSHIPCPSIPWWPSLSITSPVSSLTDTVSRS